MRVIRVKIEGFRKRPRLRRAPVGSMSTRPGQMGLWELKNVRRRNRPTRRRVGA